MRKRWGVVRRQLWVMPALAALVLHSPLSVAASTDASFVPTLVGACTFSPATGSLTLDANPTIGALPGTVPVTISGTGMCAGNAGVNVISLSLSGSLSISCAGGSGTLVGSASWSTGLPNTQPSMSATVVAGPGTVVLVLDGLAFSAVANLTWDDPVALATCPIIGASSTGLIGGLSYASQS